MTRFEIGDDDHIVVRMGPAGRGASRVYSIPLTDLDSYERRNVTAAQHRHLDDFFANQKAPKVEAARTHSTVNAFDGSADEPLPGHGKKKGPARKKRKGPAGGS